MFIRTQSMYTPKQDVNDQNNAKPVFSTVQYSSVQYMYCLYYAWVLFD